MHKQDSSLLINHNKSHLLVVDIQTRLAQVMSDRQSLLRNCEILIKSAKLLNVTTTVTEQYPKGIGPTEPELANAMGSDYSPIEKTCFSCCGSDKFMTKIQQSNKQQIVLCGIESHICVLQTAMDLLQNGRQVFIAADAVDSRSNDNKNLALIRLQQAGATIASTESIVFEWLKDAKHEQFKNVSALIR